MSPTRLRVFISSKMHELAVERAAIKAALDELQLEPWVFEENAGARPESIRQTFLTEVECSDLYIGVFWKEFGEHTIEEFEHARSLGKDCLIYEKRDFRDGPRDPKLEDFLNRFRDVNSDVTVKWFYSGEELAARVKEDVARWQATIVHAYKDGSASGKAPVKVEDGDRSKLLILLRRVRQCWIEGVLKKSVHQKMLIALGKEILGNAVENPWTWEIELPNQRAQTIPNEKKIWEIYDELETHLLILGEPGSGKTTTLLQLAEFLLTRSENDAALPIPVILILSSWTNKYRSLADWIVDELKTQYQIPGEIGRKWLKDQELLVLLDGLDEVNPIHRMGCLAAINLFLTETLFGIVICCRLAEYRAIGEQLKLGTTICLQPLTGKQIDKYLEDGGPKLAAMRMAVTNDLALQDLIKTPLILSIASLAYQGRSIDELANGDQQTPEELREKIFKSYIERMFERKGKSSQVYPNEKVKFWLGWMASQMQKHSQTLFLIERMQPDCLASPSQFMKYLLASRIFAVFFLAIFQGIGGLIGFLVLGGDLDNFPDFFLFLLVLLCLSGLATFEMEGIWHGWISRKRWRLKYNIFRLIGYGIFSSILVLVLSLSDPVVWKRPLEEIALMLFFLITSLTIVQWITFGASEGGDEASTEIAIVETLKWSWSGFFRSCLRSIGVAFILSAIFSGAIMYPEIRAFSTLRASITTEANEIQRLKEKQRSEPTTFREMNELSRREDRLRSDRYSLAMREKDPPLKEAFLLAVFLTLLIGIPIGFLLGALKSEVIDKKTTPNQGIRLILRNAVLSALGMGPVIGVVFGVIFYISARFLVDRPITVRVAAEAALVACLVLGFLVGFRMGGYSFIKHYCLRAVLVLTGKIPWKYSRFLDHCVSLIFLQQVGSGYIFIHRLLLEHFASSYDETGQPKDTTQ